MKMGKCSKCGKKILYNKYVIYEGRVLCTPCNVARLLKETEEKEAAKAKRAINRKLAKASKKAKKAAKEQGVDMDFLAKPIKEDDDDGTQKSAD